MFARSVLKKAIIAVSVCVFCLLVVGMELGVYFGVINRSGGNLTTTNDIDTVSLTDENPIEYQALEKLKFKSAIEKFAYEGFLIGDCTTLSAQLLTALSEARIPSKKLMAISKYINENYKKIASSTSVSLGGLFSFVVEDDEGLNIHQSFLSLIESVNGGLSGFMNDTQLTEEEIARFLYAYLSVNGSKEYKTAATAIGKNAYVALFSQTMKCVGSVCLSLGENVSIEQAGVLHSALYELGNSLTGTVNIVGVVGLETLFYLRTERAFGDALSEAEVVTLSAIREESKGLFGNALYILGSALKRCRTEDFENVFAYVNADENAENKDKLFIRAYCGIASALRGAMNDSYASISGQTEISCDEHFIGKYSALFLDMQRLTDMVFDIENRDYEEYSYTATEYLNDYFSAIDTLSAQTDTTLDALSALPAEKLAALETAANSLKGSAALINAMFTGTLVLSYANYYIKAFDLDDILSGLQVSSEEKDINDYFKELYG